MAVAQEWYYSVDGERSGPVSGAALKELAMAGKLGSDDLIWKDGMPDWVKASRIKGLFPTSEQPVTAQAPVEIKPVVQASGQVPAAAVPMAKLARLHMPATETKPVRPDADAPAASSLAVTAQTAITNVPVAGSVVNKAVGGLKGLWGRVNASSAAIAQSLSTGSQSASVTQDGGAISGVATTPPPRMPDGVSDNQVIVEAPAVYEGGHPKLIEKATGRLLLADSGIFFVADNPNQDVSIDYRYVRDILEPRVGQFPKDMIDRAEGRKQAAKIGAGAGRFAGSLMGGFGGNVVRAVAGSASEVVQGATSLGPPPKNRVTLVVIDGGATHRVLFDIGGVTREAIEQQAAALWLRVATVRPKFGGTRGVSAPLPASQNAAGSPVATVSYRLLAPGGSVSVVSANELSERIGSGQLAEGSLVCVEAWVPVTALFALSSPAIGGSQVGVPNSSYNPDRITSTHTVKPSSPAPHSSGIPVAAAAVGGLIVGGAVGIAVGTAMTSSVPHGNGNAGSRIRHTGRSQIAADTDGDGVIDTVGVDTDGDGVIDTVGMDTDGDGDVDVIGVDTDGDGDVDVIGMDTDGDGDVDVIESYDSGIDYVSDA